MKTIGVLGCGLMGAGIAQVSAASGFRTIVLEVNDAVLAKGLARIDKVLSGAVEKGKLSADDKARTLANLTGTTRYADLKDCDLVIEAIVEQVDAKRAAYQQVEAVVGPQCLIATNTSSLCVTELAAATTRPDRFGGLHFFNPVPMMKLVEVIRALTTTPETHEALMQFARALGKDAVSVPDRGGFIVNRLLIPYLLDAIRCHEGGLGTVEDIDTAMKLGCGHPMGPFTLVDFIGLDTTYFIANILFDEFKEARFAPPAVLKRMVLAGHLGKKSGRGFYTY
ncbi:MAG: 3-hydroxybutyryl-CoA dehydrogenase [Acidobacteria bacterium]|nr:3-hydroxybutyryl-CoA dehydrogenase [Acidobacteriota bacterium]